MPIEQQPHAVEVEEQQPGRVEQPRGLAIGQPAVEIGGTLQVIGVLGDLDEAHSHFLHNRRRASRGSTRDRPRARVRVMTTLAVILLIVGIVLLLFGLFVEAAQFLLWIGIIILVVAIIVGLMRYIRRGA